jgi:guanosine-3',5'-bis(diphosphate) 3'-pyrophosphohydrolase
MGECCHPAPGDAIIGYITRSRGVTVHKLECPNVVHEKEKERLIEVEWGVTETIYPAKVQVEAWDRMGLIRDITTLVAEEKVNIASVSFANRNDNTAITLLSLETNGLAQLSRIMEKIEGVRGVISVNRVGDETVLTPVSSAGQESPKTPTSS